MNNVYEIQLAREILQIKDVKSTLYFSIWSRDKEFFYFKEMCGKPDDAGCDWVTDNKGNTYIGWNKDWKVSSDLIVAKLIDVGNYLMYGEELKVEES